MKFAFLALAVLAIAALLIAIKGKAGGRGKKGTFAARTLATANEQKMFWRLVEAFPAPEYLVLPQVSFGALLTAKGGASRYSFSQKRADFVLASKGFKVIAIIELDDNSHNGRGTEDASRDAMLTEAGYRVLRYTGIPDATRLLSDALPTPNADRPSIAA